MSEKMSPLPRDFVGYGKDLPKVKWPKGAQLALTIAVNYEAGSERAVGFGDDAAETFGEFPMYGAPPKRDMAIESIFEYETRVAIWRMLRLFDKHKVKTTFFATAKTLETNPEAAKEIVGRGHEICSHGLRWIEHFTLSLAEERDVIRKAIALIEKTTGQRPLGWYCREPSENTIELLAEEGGFVYGSDIYNDDLPYYVNVKDKNFLLIPYTPDVNDFHYFSNRFSNSEEFYQYLKDSFDVMYEEGLKNPKLMNVGLHVRISGRPGRTAGVDRFLKYVRAKRRVWIARRIDVARWWLDHYKPQN
ncbi:MAG TPA: polysaccharide deacetylase family protein [Candidatus Acidoferrales bacterium]|nr:polysaccharide deacetylase family protein [Candidatus Acidoferrales bacterium]